MKELMKGIVLVVFLFAIQGQATIALEKGIADMNSARTNRAPAIERGN